MSGEGVMRMIAKYPMAQINKTSVPHALYAKFFGDKCRLQLKHLRELARNNGLFVFHSKNLSQERQTNFTRMVELVRLKFPEDKPDIAPAPPQEFVDAGITAINSSDGDDDDDASSAPGCDESAPSQASGVLRDRFGIPMRFSKQAQPLEIVSDDDGMERPTKKSKEGNAEERKGNVDKKKGDDEDASDVMQLANMTDPIPPETRLPTTHVFTYVVAGTYESHKHMRHVSQCIL